MSQKDRFGLIGHTIASTFRVDSLVAEGGFGLVYRAYHLHFRSPVALKCLKIPAELSDKERSDFLESFRREAEIMFRLSSHLPHVVRPLHVDAVHTPQGQFVPLLAMEWLEGKSFEKIIEQRSFSAKDPLSLEELFPMLTPVAHTLEQAHHFGPPGDQVAIVHRDIKPDNLVLCTVGTEQMVKILDFGISKVRKQATQLAGLRTQTEEIAPFSPAYGAPEQWSPKRFGQTGAWTDVWGLALTMVEIMKGDCVIVGDHAAMMGAVLDPKARPTPKHEGIEVSDAVEGVFRKALALDPVYRYQSIRDFWDALEHALRQAPRDAAPKSSRPVKHEVEAKKSRRSSPRSALPPMMAPTPWTPPQLHLLASPMSGSGLPPMTAPCVIEATSTEEAQALVEASFPKSPHSGLAPLLPAPLSASHPPDFRVQPVTDSLRSSTPQLPELELLPPLELELAQITDRPPAHSSRPGKLPPSRPASLPEIQIEIDEEALADDPPSLTTPAKPRPRY